MRESRRHRRMGQLQPFAPVQLAAPQYSFGITYVGSPLAISGNVHVACRNAAKERAEFSALCVVLDQLCALLRASYKQLLAILARQRIRVLQRSARQPD